MGRDPDSIASEIEQERDRCARRIHALRERVATDLDDLQSLAYEKLPAPVHRVKGHFDEHPLIHLFAGLGAGLAIGTATAPQDGATGAERGGGADPGIVGSIGQGFAKVATPAIGNGLASLIADFGRGWGESRGAEPDTVERA